MSEISQPAGLRDGVVIAGGGLAAQRCAETLRRNGYERPIRMLCAEPERPYDRPPLSKEALLDASHDAALPYRPAGWYRDHDVDLELGVAACALRPAERRLWCSDGRSLRYAALLIATGGRPRRLELLRDYRNVSVLRDVEHARALREVLAAGPRLTVVGAGFIGLEIAASARRLGAEVSLVEAAPSPLAAVLGEELGAWFARLHGDRGVAVRCGVTIAAVHGAKTVTSLRLSDGTDLATDHVVVGTGISPVTDWLQHSGLDTIRGVAVDAAGRTAIPGVFAAGDVAATYDPVSGHHVPGSHWEAAGRQGAASACAMLGLPTRPAGPASFWTDQYGLRIQYVGRRAPGDVLAIDGEPDRHDFTATFTRAGRPVAVVLVNRPHALPAARQLIQKGASHHVLPC